MNALIVVFANQNVLSMAIEPDTNKNTEKLVILNKEMSANGLILIKKKIHCLMQINLKIYLTNLKSTLAINLAQVINNLVSLY
jgi:formyltetrahydrofolate hydrolase